MAHFKPFYYTSTDPLTGDWRRLFVEPGRSGGVSIELMGMEGSMSITMPPLKFEIFADRCVAAYETLVDDEDWIGEEI